MEYQFNELVELYKFVQIQMVLKHVTLKSEEIDLLEREKADIAEKYGLPYEKKIATENAPKLDDEKLASYIAQMKNTTTSWQTEERKKYIQETVILIGELKKSEKDDVQKAEILAGYLFPQLLAIKDTYSSDDINAVVRNPDSKAFSSAYFTGLAKMLTTKFVEKEIEVSVEGDVERRVIKTREAVEIKTNAISRLAIAARGFLMPNFNQNKVEMGLKEESPFYFDNSKIFEVMDSLANLMTASLHENTNLGIKATATQKAAKIEAERLAKEEAARVEAEKLAAEKLAAEEAAKAEAERLAAEKLAAEEAAKAEAEKLALEKQAEEADKLAQEEPAKVELDAKPTTSENGLFNLWGLWGSKPQVNLSLDIALPEGDVSPEVVPTVDGEAEVIVDAQTEEPTQTDLTSSFANLTETVTGQALSDASDAEEKDGQTMKM